MVATFMPRMVRAMSGKEARATPVHLNQRGMEAGHGRLGERGGALGSAFGEGQGRGDAGDGTGGQPLFGGFQRSGGILGFGRSLTPHGEAQKADAAAIDKFVQSYQSLKQGGATGPEAFAGAWKANPNSMLAFSHHPDALTSFQHLSQVLEGSGGGSTAPMYTQVKGADGRVYNVPMDPQTGQAGPAEAVPGLPGTPAKPGKPTLLKTDQGYATLTPGSNQAQFVLGPNGQSLRPAPRGAAAKQPPLAQSDIQGLPPQATADVPKTAFNRQNYNTLATTPAVMQALGRIQQAAGAMGPLKGPLASLSGQYFGLNGQGAQFRADLDLIQSQAQRMAGSGYKAATENFIKGIGSASDAPSFLKLQSAQMMTTLRSEAQSTADEETASHQGKLPPSLAHQLISVGVVPNGYQNQQTLDQMPPGEAALWKSRNFPQALTPADKNQLFTDAAHGKFGPPGQANQNPDFKAIIGIHQQYKAQQQAQAQQGVASQAATAVQPAAQASSANPGQGTPGLGGQPAEGANAGAGQPANGQVQNSQPGQQGAAQPPANPQQLGQQGQDQNGQGQGVAPQPAGAGLLMPPQAVPGQPAQGVPATGGSTPMPAVNPLPAAPQTSQMLTPQGGMPTPAVQAPLAATAPGSQVPTSAGGALVQAHQDALAAQAQAEQENGGQPVAAPSAEGLSLMPGM